MPKLPTINGKQLVKFLESLNFKVIRKKGSHVRLQTEDGRAILVTVKTKKERRMLIRYYCQDRRVVR